MNEIEQELVIMALLKRSWKTLEVLPHPFVSESPWVAKLQVVMILVLFRFLYLQTQNLKGIQSLQPLEVQKHLLPQLKARILTSPLGENYFTPTYAKYANTSH